MATSFSHHPFRFLLIIVIASWIYNTAGSRTNYLSPVLDLHIGFRRSLFELLNITMYGTTVYSSEYDNFYPFLSSRGFNIDTTSLNGSSYGFAFGVLYKSAGLTLSVCAGFLGNAFDSSLTVPLWVLDTMHGDNASLVVVSKTGKPELQLLSEDGTDVLWSVNDVGRMEVLDNGSLVIYDSMLNKVVWRRDYESNNSYVLLPGQKLTLGEQLTSKDSVYSLRVHQEGLSFNLNSVKYEDSSYVFIPFTDQVCTDQPPYDTSLILDSLYNRLFYRQSCSHNSRSFLYLSFQYDDSFQHVNFGTGVIFSFVTLETDGHLYVHVPLTSGSIVTEKYVYFMNTSSNADLQDLLLPGCDTPMACGLMGICNPRAPTHCSCPSSNDLRPFKFYNDSNMFQGCTRFQPLPNCSTSTASWTIPDPIISYLPLNQTATVLLVRNSPSPSYFRFPFFASFHDCKMNCSSSCHCQGFIFDSNYSNSPLGGCYLIRDDIGSLLHIEDQYYSTITTFLKVVSHPRTKINIRLITIISASILSASLIIVGIALHIIHRRKTKLRALKLLEERELQNIIPSMVHRFSFKDLHKATQGFNSNNILGRGGCGDVYKGILIDGQLVAVKMLGSSNVLTKEQTKQLFVELACVCLTSHHNIMRLLGFCWEKSQLLVVYEYLQKGSLDQWLFNPKRSITLDWRTRFNMAIGIAQGIHYLHEECTKPILHFDIKPQNILLDEHLEPKLADFGLSKLITQRDISQVVTGVRGTPGYIAPEWLSHGSVSKKADVYSMGMVFLEIVSGRRNIDLSFLDDSINTHDKEKWHFPSWAARKCEQGFIREIIDMELNGNYVDEQVQRVVFTSFWCINEDPCMRPSMRIVLQWLNGVSLVPTPKFLLIYAHERSHIKPSYEQSEVISFSSFDSLVPR